MKLELKHLAPYLPYGLVCELKDQGKTTRAKLSGAYIDNSYAFFDTVESEHGYDSIKPVLKPMKDADEFLQKEYGVFAYNGFSKFSLNNSPFGAVQVLLKHHFDVFGLIPKGLAIDMNDQERLG